MIDINRGLRRAVRELLPPIVARLIRPPPPPALSFSGTFDTFAAAALAAGSSGYQDPAAVSRSIAATADHRARIDAAPEAVLDSRVPQLLAAFLLALGQGQGQGIDRPKGQPVTVLDLGGATGHHFFALAPFLTKRWQLDWTVCELPALAQAGATAFGDRIKFVSSLDQLGGARFDVVLASGSLQYVPEPGPTCEALLDRCDHLIINRSPFVAAQKADRLTVQEVQTEQGPIRYPAWFLSRDGWFDRIRRRGFKIELCWPNPEDHVVLDGETIGYSGLLARRRGADEVP